MLLGLDLGTTNVKAVVTDSDGQIRGQASMPVTLFHVGAGGVEQDIEEIWSATIGAVRQATRDVERSRVQAIGISSQGGALQLLDAQHRPQGRVISWLDGRGAADDERLTCELGRAWFVEHISHGGSALAAGQFARLGREQPGLLASPNRIGFVGDVIVGRLCGRPAHDGTSCALTLLYNPARRDYDADLLRRLGLDATQLPELVAPPSPAGRLLPDVARQLGLPAGLPISPAIHDQYASALGCGAVHAGDVMFGAGTAWVLLAVTDRLLDPVTDDALVSHHVADNLHGQILSLRNGGSAFTWALKLAGLEALSGVAVDQKLKAVPPGCDGLMFRPLLGAFGATGVAAGTKGCLEGLQLAHTAAHLLRSVVEGLAFELNRHLEFLRGAGISMQRLLMTGGAAASTVTPQIIADVTGVPVVCQTGAASSSHGAVILARSMIPGQASLRELAEAMAPTGRMISPGPDTAFYQQQFKQYVRSLPTVASGRPPQSNTSGKGGGLKR
jgi:xylulokinase